MRHALIKCRQRNNNLLIVGHPSWGKSFLLDPLELIFNALVNPATSKYAWANLENKEVAFLNDFRWSPEYIAWSDFLLLLEGQIVNLPHPKNQFATDLLIDRSNNLTILATSKAPVKYVGKFNLQDEWEIDIMASRRQMFSFNHQIAHYGKSLIFAFQELFARVDKIFILEERLHTWVSFYEV